MANVFQMSNERVKDVNRNTFDLSFQNNLTMKFGALYPVFCKEVLPGDTVKIRPTFALEFMPMVFPVQTRMKANLHFFYVRRRPLWNRFMDFMADLTDEEPPYLDFNANFDEYTQTGRLGDYFGLPTTIIGGFENAVSVTTTNVQLRSSRVTDIITASSTGNSEFTTLQEMFSAFAFSPKAYYGSFVPGTLNRTTVSMYDVTFADYNLKAALSAGISLKFGVKFVSPVSATGIDSVTNSFGCFLRFSDDVIIFLSALTNDSPFIKFSKNYDASEMQLNYEFVIAKEHPLFSQISALYPDGNVPTDFSLDSVFVCPNVWPSTDALVSVTNPNKVVLAEWSGSSFTQSYFTIDATVSIPSYAVLPITRDVCPFYDSSSDKKDKQKKISAEPFRAYEAIYNAFYRDIRNNPLILNGKPEYNKYIPTDEGGVDTYPYKMHYRNWEKDFLTTAVQSPQQGVAPLVGITNYVNNLNADVTFIDESGKEYKARLQTTDDGEFIKSVNVDSSDLPSENLRALVDYAQSGISINDFRNVNSFQLWLEVNMRQGLRFKDIIKGHYDVNVRYDELQMPEFIGGCSEDVRVNMVTQTSADTEDSPLGSYAGQATCVGTSKNKITHYCDEPGYIIGILSVTPVPNYSQLLPKHFLKRDVLDIFTPEFGHIGFQPITYAEVCPVQAFNENPASLDDTFGYQRAWYDYLASTDEVHGLFRTELRNYLIGRVFDVKPELSESFLLVDPAVTNAVFSNTTENDDKILGQVYFDCKMKRPIPLYGVPRLE